MATMFLPVPTHASTFYDTSAAASREDLLPTYDALRDEHVSSTSLSRGGTPWLTLNVQSSDIARSSSQTMPLYKKPGSVVSGDIVMMLDRPETVQAIKVSIRGISSYASGETSTPGSSLPTLGNAHTFMEVTETLWSSSDGIPTFAEPPPWGFPRNGKLQGKFTFPFTLRLPEELPSESPHLKDVLASYVLPGSWFDKRSPAAIDYDVAVTLVRGALKTNTSLTMGFYYAPRSRPEPPSELRRLAYINGTPALDPLGDPAGWHIVNPPSKVKGKLSNGRSVDVLCTFALAKPLSYSRGTVIPMNLAIQCSDPGALDLLQSPLAVSIILLQCVTTGKNAHSEKQRLSSRDVHVSPVARAVCWRSSSSAGDWENCRTLMGEIALPKKMPPTIISPRVVIRYSVVMLPFDIAGFTVADPHSFMVDQPIDVTTHDADGPIPQSQIPSGYVDPRRHIKDRFEQMMDAVSMFR